MSRFVPNKTSMAVSLEEHALQWGEINDAFKDLDQTFTPKGRYSVEAITISQEASGIIAKLVELVRAFFKRIRSWLAGGYIIGKVTAVNKCHRKAKESPERTFKIKMTNRTSSKYNAAEHNAAVNLLKGFTEFSKHDAFTNFSRSSNKESDTAVARFEDEFASAMKALYANKGVNVKCFANFTFSMREGKTSLIRGESPDEGKVLEYTKSDYMEHLNSTLTLARLSGETVAVLDRLTRMEKDIIGAISRVDNSTMTRATHNWMQIYNSMSSAISTIVAGCDDWTKIVTAEE